MRQPPPHRAHTCGCVTRTRDGRKGAPHAHVSYQLMTPEMKLDEQQQLHLPWQPRAKVDKEKGDMPDQIAAGVINIMVVIIGTNCRASERATPTTCVSYQSSRR